MGTPRTVEELEQLLREAEQRAEEAEKNRQDERRRADEERQRADEERRRADEEQRRADEEQRRADEAEEQTRPTSLSEYVAACHSLVFSRLNVETNPDLSSRGSVTNPRNKLCPTNLRPWADFLELQRFTFGALLASFPTERRAFESRSFLTGLGNRISLRSVSNEKTLEYFQHNSVEDPVRCILDQLKEVEETKAEFHLGNGIVFENHPHAISDVSEEVVQQTSSTPPRTPGHGLDLHQLRPDQICVYRSDDASLANLRTMIYVIEYKAPHKLTASHLRAGLRSMDIYKDVVNRKTIPTSVDPDALFRYHAERLTASAITQTYHYMIEGGLEYGVLTTGEAMVFLKVNWQEPETLYFHLAEPASEVSAHPVHFQLCTAVGQYLAFSLMTLSSERRGHGQEERQMAIQRLKRWAEDFETTLRSIPPNERSVPDGSSGYAPTTYSEIDRSPYPLRFKRRIVVGQDEPTRDIPRRDTPESSDDESAPRPPDTPSPTERRKPVGGQGARRSQRLAQRSRGGGEQDGQYCTQRCLLGLVRGEALDSNCPNVKLHTRQRGVTGARGLHHPVDHDTWLRLLGKQLKQSLDDGITPLQLGGARGVLFKVTLLMYGYTFVCKGTVGAFVKDLEHEAAVYERLRQVQGINVPVFLGAIDLRSMNKTYYYDFRVYIIHMTFLSWGGYKLDKVGLTGMKPVEFSACAIRSLQAIHREGVVHQDVRSENMLLNPEANSIMMIDFERATLLERPRRPVGQLVPNKRAWEQNGKDDVKAVKCFSRRNGADGGVEQDIAMAKATFSERTY
ncbi:hypothetical protein N0V84_012377 [Fusarium piperis]|uniref:EKC/KEOPS complex subunit BUD32 n=1 Tax=Fusarium piperis TaxID=1435070 RepID=A0A9W8TA78_9HYPO|nr:hypothetical protein N0V84_012377 [Fusarium piperis]